MMTIWRVKILSALHYMLLETKGTIGGDAAIIENLASKLQALLDEQRNLTCLFFSYPPHPAIPHPPLPRPPPAPFIHQRIGIRTHLPPCAPAGAQQCAPEQSVLRACLSANQRTATIVNACARACARARSMVGEISVRGTAQWWVRYGWVSVVQQV